MAGFGDVIQLLQQGQIAMALSNPLAVHSAVLPTGYETLCFEDAVAAFGRTSACSLEAYPLRWLFDDTLTRVAIARAAGHSAVELPNGCCTLESCPQMCFRRLVVMGKK